MTSRMARHIVNTRGEIEVDPFDWKGKHDRWFQKVTTGEVDYGAFPAIAPRHSELLVRFFLDLASGRNCAKGHRKEPRSHIYMVNFRHHLHATIRLLEERTGKRNMDFTEEEVLAIFQGMRQGAIKRTDGKPYLDVSTITKRFASFWHWHIRTERRKGTVIPDIVESLDTSYDHKPKWHHFTLHDAERMADAAPRYEYKALIYFLFDTRIRAPKELMNVRAMDLAAIPGSSQILLTIREETSKTFGRKIKLMLCSDIIRKYVEENKLNGTDFLFARSPIIYNRVLAKLGKKVLGIGTPHEQRKPNGQVHKTLIKHGITMYDFRHNSVCHYLPIYKSENQMKYRYGWKKSDMIHYYSEYLGMKDTITEDDMLVDTTKTQLEQALTKEQQKTSIMEERFNAEKNAMEERIQKLEAMMLQRFANNF